MQSTFDDILERVEGLPPDERQMLMDIVQKRLVEQRRLELQSEIERSRLEFKSGKCKTKTADEILDEVLP
jgi:hypothetical protein